MHLDAYLGQKKQIISTHLLSFLKQKGRESNQHFFKDAIERLSKFTVRGKMLRGTLLLFIYESLGAKVSKKILSASAALELAHSAFLIHDDIIDNDIIRRGEKTIFAQYKDFAKKQNVDNTTHYGTSMGICVGDIAFFLSLELIARVLDNHKISTKINYILLRELQSVAGAEMKDIHLGQTHEEPTLDEILNEVYKYKTSRYTFSLPFVMGAQVAGANEKLLSQLDSLGEKLGVIFQIKDDELGIFGDEKDIGKPVGSDIIENKKTILRFFLYKSVTSKEKKFLDGIFGNKDAKIDDVEKVKKLFEKYHIQNEINKIVLGYVKQAIFEIEGLPVREKYRLMLKDLVEYNTHRNV